MHAVVLNYIIICCSFILWFVARDMGMMNKRSPEDVLFTMMKIADENIKGSFKFSSKHHTANDIHRNRAVLLINGTIAVIPILANSALDGSLRRGLFGYIPSSSYSTNSVYRSSMDANVALQQANALNEHLANGGTAADFETCNIFGIDDVEHERVFIDSDEIADHLHGIDYYLNSDDEYDKCVAWNGSMFHNLTTNFFVNKDKRGKYGTASRGAQFLTRPSFVHEAKKAWENAHPGQSYHVPFNFLDKNGVLCARIINVSFFWMSVCVCSLWICLEFLLVGCDIR